MESEYKQPEGAPKDYNWSGSLLYLILAVLGLIGAVFCIFLIKGNASSADDNPVLEILNATSGKAYFCRSMEDGGEFAIEFFHSEKEYYPYINGKKRFARVLVRKI
jgi:hypothetical protein